MTELVTAIKRAGGPAAVASKLGVSTQRLCNWMARGVPIEYCAPVEKVIGVQRQQLRPDDWFRIWPELPGADRAAKAAIKETA